MRAHDANAQVSYFQGRLQSLKHILDDIPPILQLFPPADEVAIAQDPNNENTSEIATQFASMRVNIHITHLWLQSLVMDQIEAAQARQTFSHHRESSFIDQREFWLEREELCRQLFFVLYNSSRVSLEANGLHLANKVRDIAASLLACPFPSDDPISKQAAEYVQQASDMLSRLDSSEGVNTLHLQTWVDTDRMQQG